jgi:hypothetical protein
MFKKQLFSKFSKLSSADSSRSNSAKSAKSVESDLESSKPKLTIKYEWTPQRIKDRLENTLPLPRSLWHKLGVNDVICFTKKDGTFSGGYNIVSKKTEKGVRFGFNRGNNYRTWCIDFGEIAEIYIQKTILFELMHVNMKKIDYIISEFEKLKS